MSTKLLLTINAIVAIVYGLLFTLAPTTMSSMYSSVAPEPFAMLDLQFFGSALLGWGIITGAVRNVRDKTTIRGVLIGNIVGQAVGGYLNVTAITRGLFGAFGWTSALVYVLLLVGGLYCLYQESRETA